ncbi:MAG: hypothetical protein K8U57_29735, partial [Planctomycetes bacterium]|nr:hypothetical protein [Planctomycetota bacterium]
TSSCPILRHAGRKASRPACQLADMLAGWLSSEVAGPFELLPEPVSYKTLKDTAGWLGSILRAGQRTRVSKCCCKLPTY